MNGNNLLFGNKERKNSRFVTYYTLLISFFLITLFSCKKDNNEKIYSGVNLRVDVKVAETRFEDLGIVNSSVSNSMASLNSSQTSVVELSDDIMMVSELKVEGNDKLEGSSSIIKNGTNNAAVIYRVPLNDAALYKVVVFKKDGTYVAEREYIHRQEQKTEKLLLDGGDYIFIAYSLNNVAKLPVFSYYDNNTNNKNLSNVYISASNVQDILFERIDKELGEGKDNNLNLVFRHKFNYIATVVDATQTNYEIANIIGYLSPIYPNANVKFSDGSISRSGTSSSIPLTFKSVSPFIFEAEGVIINAPSNVNLLTISAMTVGPNIVENQTPFRNLAMVPGARYKLLVRLVPKDKYVGNYKGYPVVKINGVQWMRYNLGADPGILDDDNSVVLGQHGNFYQWGREYALALGESNHLKDYPPSSWDPYVNIVPSAWNKGTFEKPTKGDRDPCPDGFRIPNLLELDSLRKGTVATLVGDWNKSSTNYEAGVLFRSIRNKDVFITLPAQGAYTPSGIDGQGLPGNLPFNFGGLVYRADWSACWASNLDVAGVNANKGLVGRLRVVSFNNNARVDVDYRRPASTENTVGAYPVRCVVE